MARLHGKRAIITGGGNGIGAAAAMLFVREGAQVAILDTDREAGERAAAAAEAEGGEVLFLQADVSEPEDVEDAIDEAAGTFGGLDVLYNNAGGAAPRDGSFLDIPLEEFWRTVSVDLYGTFLASRIAVPYIQEAGGGAVINTASIRALKGTRGADAYSAAKGGIVALTRAMALQCGPLGIRVNAIAPGAVLTDRTRGLGMTDEIDPQWRVAPGQPLEVAELAVFLASDEASLVNGAIIPADGGGAAF
ncbi:SDR family oxidoreductase [Pelagibius sp. CAU 1746]|uniref:SDR family oxidoreductase n=1 Tax=Pelagibius sp. CAU 1746 TaxID=3140370 RepID=UPI00325B4ECC